ncbi:phage head-tail adapter protein [Paenibacillus sp. FSL M7-0547]|uniref:phage head-tail adapter protein n=1 Tax=Paenibacillus sp. FSL M7-0547 TaxID=2954755 RepID=UPI0030F5FEF6
MTYDYELTLITQSSGTNADADPIIVEEETVILCGLNSVGRSEFYAAAATGLRPELVFTIHGYEYDGQQLVEFDGVRYKVLRTYGTGYEELELTCQREAGASG